MTERTIQPWLKWYPRDWRADPRLQLCSLGARGLWLELIGFMHESEPYGHLVLGEGFVTDKRIAVLVGAPVALVKKCMEELEKNGVFSLDSEGRIFSRRMVRDHAQACKDKRNGKLGGNPTVMGVNPQNPEARDQKARGQKPEKKEAPIGAIAVAPAPAPAKPPKRKIPIPIPDDFILTGPRAQEAIAARLDAAATFEAFRRWALHTAAVSANWDVRWVMWISKQVQINANTAEAASEDGRRVTHWGEDGLPRFGPNDG